MTAPPAHIAAGLATDNSRWVVGSRLVGIVAVNVGAGIGAGTLLLQKWLPESLMVLGNSGLVWSLGALLLGLAMRSLWSAAVGGAVALVAASISYYLTADWIEGVGFNARSVIVWALAAMVAGPAFGIAGHAARRSRHRRTAWALFGGAMVGEGIRLLSVVDNRELRPAGMVAAAVGSAIILLGLRSKRPTILVIVTCIGGAVATFLASHIIEAVLMAL